MEDAGRNGRRPRRDSRPLDSFAKLYERPLPFSLEAEMALLGAMILDPKVVPDVMSAVGVRRISTARPMGRSTRR